MADEHAAAYREAQARIEEVVAGVDTGTTVPACPAWTVHDLVAHLTGLAADVVAYHIGGYGSDEWPDAQVEARRDRSFPSLLEEWRSAGTALAERMADPAAHGIPDFMPVVILTDLAAHEHDLRHALGRPGARDSAAVRLGLASQIGGMRLQFAEHGVPPLRVVAEGMREWMVGRGDAEAAVRGDGFELFRATGGRRTRDEVRALDWEGDAEPFIDYFLFRTFSWPEHSLEE